MALFRNLGLLSKITLVIMVILLAFFALTSYVRYRQQRAFIMEEAVEKARIVAFEAIRAREYISDELQRGGVELSKERYGMIPVVASNRIGLLVAKDLGYEIRQVSERYRNPENAPDDFELEVLERFRNSPQIGEEFAITSVAGEPVFRYLKPFIADQSCLQCHGDPADAPAFLKEIFPLDKDQAYGYEIGEIIGAASVRIPMQRLHDQIYANVRNDLIVIGGIFLALITCLGVLTRAAIIRPLARLGKGIQEIIYTGRFEEKIPRRGRDEIGTLIDGFNEMIDHLGEKTQHLEESEKRFRVLTETARDGIISFLSNGQIILFNRQAEKIFGYSKREALGLTVDHLVHQECASLHGVGVSDYLAREAGQLMERPREIIGRRRDGTRLGLDLALSVAESDGHLFYTAILRELD